MITCTPDIFSRYISVMDFKKIFSVVVCAMGIFFSTAAGSKDVCLNSYVSADSLLLYEYYETYVMIRPLNYLRVFPEQKAVAPDWFHYRDRVIELRVLALRKRIREEYPQDYPLGRGSVRVWLMFSLRTGELVTAELMFLKEVLEVVDSFPAREIIAMCMNSDWSGSTYIMEHEPDKYDSMYTEYFFSLYY